MRTKLRGIAAHLVAAFACAFCPLASAASPAEELQRTSPPVEVVLLLMGSYENGFFVGDIWLRARFKNNSSKAFSMTDVYITPKEFKVVPPKDKDHAAYPSIGFKVLSPDILIYPSETRPWKPGETVTLTRDFHPFGADAEGAKNFSQSNWDMFEYFTVKLKLQPNELLNVTQLVNCFWVSATPAKWK
jgi:hypothetical protein